MNRIYRFGRSAFTFTMLGLAFLAWAPPSSHAAEAKDLLGYWQGKYTPEPGVNPERKDVPITLDLWQVKDKVMGVFSMIGIIYEVASADVEGDKMEFRTKSNSPRGAETLYKGTVTVDGGTKKFKGQYIGLKDMVKGDIDLTWVPPAKSGTPTDKELSGRYTGTSKDGTYASGEPFEMSIVLDLQSDEVGGRVILTGKNQKKLSMKEDIKMQEIRRNLDRIYFHWVDSKGQKGRFIGTTTAGTIDGIVFAPGFGGGSVALKK